MFGAIRRNYRREAMAARLELVDARRTCQQFLAELEKAHREIAQLRGTESAFDLHGELRVDRWGTSADFSTLERPPRQPAVV